MQGRPDEVSAILRDQLQRLEKQIQMVGVGTVLEIGDGIARLYGLADVMSSELVEFPGDLMGIALNLEEDNVGCILMGPYEHVKEGDEVRTTGRIASTKVGDELFGRVVTPLGEALDGKGPVVSTGTRPLEVKAPGVIARQPVKEPLHTGIKPIDAMIPIGRGQRELIIGDRKTGKTAIAVDAIINQRETDVKCIYVAIGQKISSIRRTAAILEQHDALDYTCIVAASAADPAAVQYIAPYAGCTIGEYVRDEGGHALVIYDDLTSHAKSYRQVSLLLRRPPGREAYPGDIFNLHSRLLERAAKLSDARGGGSLTALPVIQTEEGDYAAYIPTNLISITDGQIYLEPELFYAGIRPAISVGLSVSRVGGSAQTKMMRAVAGRLKLDLASYREYRAFSQFASDLDETTRNILRRGDRMTEVLKQDQYVPMPPAEQVIAIFAGTHGFWDDVKLSAITDLEDQLLGFVHERYPEIENRLRTELQLDDELSAQLSAAIEDFKSRMDRQNLITEDAASEQGHEAPDEAASSDESAAGGSLTDPDE